MKGSTERHAKQKKNFENQGSNSQSCKHVADSLAARKWLKERHGNRPITGPLALEITLLDQEAAAIVESCVGFRTMSGKRGLRTQADDQRRKWLDLKQRPIA